MFFLERLINKTRAKKPVEYHIERIHNYVYLDKQYFLRARLLLGFKKLEKITKYLLVPENFQSLKKLDSGIKREFADQLEDFKLGPPYCLGACWGFYSPTTSHY